MTVTPGARVILTGTAGVIGRKLVRLLVTAGHEVLSVDREPLPEEVSGLPFDHLQDDLSTMNLEPVVAYQPEAVLHLAASFERSQESAEYWERGWRDDVVASHRLIDAVREARSLRTFLFASSYLLYDPDLYLSDTAGASAALQERSPLLPRNLCGAGKLYTERELSYIEETTRPDLRVINARIFRAYGQGSRDVVSRWVRSGLRGDKIEVYNTENSFDYVYSGDVAAVLMRLLETPEASGAYNVATGTATSISEVVDALVAEGIVDEAQVVQCGSSPPYESSVADVSALRALLGSVPATDIRSGVRLLAEHESK